MLQATEDSKFKRYPPFHEEPISHRIRYYWVRTDACRGFWRRAS